MSLTPLPVCRWRREPTLAGRHACVSPKMVVGIDGVPDAVCETCRYRDHAPPPRNPGPCVHLGPRTALTLCPGCSQHAGHLVELPLHACALHGSCTLARPVAETMCCAECPDRRPAWQHPDAGGVRHLTYFVWPGHAETFAWNMAQLRSRLSVFNGRRIVAVALTPGLPGVGDVRAALGDAADCDYLEVPNDPHLKEMAAYPLLVDALKHYTGPADATFYGHAKGMGSHVYGPTVRRWTESMYVALLDYFPAVRAALADHSAVGVWRQLRRLQRGPSWHYSGTFRWVRNTDLYARNWASLESWWGESEFHLPKLFRSDEVACLHGEYGGRIAPLYGQQAWDAWAQESCDRFYAEHLPDKETPLLATVVLTAHAQPELVHHAIESVRRQSTDSWQLLIVDSGRIAETGAYARYASDARVSLLLTGESDAAGCGPRGQSWAINQAWRYGRVRGDLVAHLSDDDVLSPDWLRTVICRARARPAEGAWYGWARHVRLHPDGREEPLPPLRTIGTGRPGAPLRGRADGMQVVHRREYRADWPVSTAMRAQADGWWMDQVAAHAPIIPLDACAGTHRHTPLSTFTR